MPLPFFKSKKRQSPNAPVRRFRRKKPLSDIIYKKMVKGFKLVLLSVAIPYYICVIYIWHKVNYVTGVDIVTITTKDKKTYKGYIAPRPFLSDIRINRVVLTESEYYTCNEQIKNCPNATVYIKKHQIKKGKYQSYYSPSFIPIIKQKLEQKS